MEGTLKELRELSAQFSEAVSQMARAGDDCASLGSLKASAISIEGRISQTIEKLRAQIKTDDHISTENREKYLKGQLGQLDIDIDRMRSRRKAAYLSSKKEVDQKREDSLAQRRAELLGDSSALEKKRKAANDEKSSYALASEATLRLIRTREIISDQINESAHSIELMQESTGALTQVGAATESAEAAGSHARSALRRLRMTQNWSQSLFKVSIALFAISVIYAIYRRATKNIIVDAAAACIRAVTYVINHTRTALWTRSNETVQAIPGHNINSTRPNLAESKA